MKFLSVQTVCNIFTFCNTLRSKLCSDFILKLTSIPQRFLICQCQFSHISVQLCPCQAHNFFAYCVFANTFKEIHLKYFLLCLFSLFTLKNTKYIPHHLVFQQKYLRTYMNLSWVYFSFRLHLYCIFCYFTCIQYNTHTPPEIKKNRQKMITSH